MASDTHNKSKKENNEFFEIMYRYRSMMHEVHQAGGKKAVTKHRNRGKLLARERIEQLIDPQTPFMELSPLAANDQYGGSFPSAGIVTGIGVIHDRESVIIANDATVKGGTYVRETIRKHVRAQEIAMENRLPVVYMVDSWGIFLPEQSRVFPDKEDFGRLFRNQA
ncbi:MAG: carboxyl transferase domain-containing protein, partial [Bacteroidales bacterium]